MVTTIWGNSSSAGDNFVIGSRDCGWSYRVVRHSTAVAADQYHTT